MQEIIWKSHEYIQLSITNGIIITIITYGEQNVYGRTTDRTYDEP